MAFFTSTDSQLYSTDHHVNGSTRIKACLLEPAEHKHRETIVHCLAQPAQSAAYIDLLAVLAGETVSDGHSVLVFCKSKQASLDGHTCILNGCWVWHSASTITTWMSLMGHSSSAQSPDHRSTDALWGNVALWLGD